LMMKIRVMLMFKVREPPIRVVGESDESPPPRQLSAQACQANQKAQKRLPIVILSSKRL